MVIRPTRSPWQQWPSRRTKNDDLSIVFFSRVGLRTYQHLCIQKDSKGQNSIFGGDSNGHCGEKIHMNMCLILNGYWDKVIWNYGNDIYTFLFVGLDEEWSLQTEGGWTRQTSRSRFGCCFLNKEKWRSTPTNTSRPAHTRCKVHCGCLRDFPIFIVNCEEFVISVKQVCHLKIKITHWGWGF